MALFDFWICSRIYLVFVWFLNFFSEFWICINWLCSTSGLVPEFLRCFFSIFLKFVPFIWVIFHVIYVMWDFTACYFNVFYISCVIFSRVILTCVIRTWNRIFRKTKKFRNKTNEFRIIQKIQHFFLYYFKFIYFVSKFFWKFRHFSAREMRKKI